MILSDLAILQNIALGTIVIDPFERNCLGPNSYDVHLSRHFAIYRNPDWLDAREPNPVDHFEIPESGYQLLPGRLYLGSTLEYTETHAHVPYLEGKSSTGRLGIDIHATAGKGDVGFCNHWTLEISCVHPVVVYPGMPIGQLIYHTVEGGVAKPYGTRENSKYQGRDPRPRESRMWMNFPRDPG